MINNSTNYANSSTKKIFFPHLNGLRTLAFLVVFLVHSFNTEHENIKNTTLLKTIRGIVSTTNLGVELFFVLSGFLITYLLLHEEKIKLKINVGHFYLRRFLRIWPLYFACVAFGFLVEPLVKHMAGKIPNETANPLLFITFLSNFNNIINGEADAQNLPVLWSVAIEEQFYLFWPLLMILFRRNRVILFLLVMIGSVVFRYINADNNLFILYHTFSVISDLAMGGLLAWLCFYSTAFVEVISKLEKKYILLIYVLAALHFLFRKQLMQNDILLAFERIITSLFFAFIIVEQSYANHSLFKIGNYKILSFWGKYTYGLYCLHFIGIIVAKQICERLGIDDTLIGLILWQTLLSLLFSMVLSYFSYEYYEKYFLKLKDRYS